MTKTSAKTVSNLSAKELLDFVTKTLEQDKAEDIVSIGLKGKSEIADYMVVCCGRSTRQVTGMAEKLAVALKTEHGIMSRIEGQGQGDWVLIDAGDILVHVFRPEVREFYQLEKMWTSADGATKA